MSISPESVVRCPSRIRRVAAAVLLITSISAMGTITAVAQVGAPSPAPSSPAPSAVPLPPAEGVNGDFTDITAKSGVNFRNMSTHTSKKYLIETMGSGVALFDYDDDGLLDIYFVNVAPLKDPTPKGTIPQKSGPEYWNRLYHQKKDGTFEDVTEKAGLQGAGYGQGVAVGDYDNDGYEDLYVTSAVGPNHLYHNNGNGTFTDVSDSSGTGGPGIWSSSAAWADLDGDGLLDLIVTRYMKWDFDDVWCGEHREGFRGYCHPDIFEAAAPLVFHNDGHGHFTEVAKKIGLDVPGKGLGIAVADYDRDGHPDVLISNDAMVEHLYHNKGDGTFEEVGLLSEVAVDGDGRTYSGMGADFSDYNNDGWPDIVITDLANQKYALYLNNGDGSFTYASHTSGIGSMTLLHSGWGISFMDYDNDGWKDLMIVQSHVMDNIELSFPQLRYPEAMLLARNTGKGFNNVSASSGDVFKHTWVSRGLAVGDIDNDGRLDAVISTNDGPAYVIHNDTQSKNHWLLLHLVGHKSNRDAIGAQIKLTTPHGSQYVTVSTTGSYQSSKDKRAHFGMGSDLVAQSIEIRWPSGILQVLKDVKADQILKVDEPSQPAGPAGVQKP